ncbi:MAG TPA: GNAT family N-acetyltransferase [Myxococcales bacterium]|nr:GNAT family N-acetyltransferase [Myxococcales bacterium]
MGRVVTSVHDLDALAPAWSALHHASGAGVFQSWEWQRTWWRHFGEVDRRRRLFVVVLEARGQVCAIAPFFVEQVPVFPGLGLRRLSFIGSGVTDYLDVLVSRGEEQAVCEEIAACLARHSSQYEVIWLRDLADGSPVRIPLLAALRRNGFEGDAFPSEHCPRLPLQPTWRETLAAFAGKYRRKVIGRMRKLSENFTVELEMSDNESDIVSDVDDFMAMHQHRFVQAGKKGVFAEAVVRAFQREIAASFFRRGWLRLAFLKVDGKRVASICGFAHRGEFAHYLSGMRETSEVARFSPGITLIFLCMEALHLQGIRLYDFLRGTEPYKHEIGATSVPNWSIVVTHRGARLARAKNVVSLLGESLVRRADQERIAFNHHRARHGVLSRDTVRYLWNRLGVILRDGLKKARAPAKSLTAAE